MTTKPGKLKGRKPVPEPAPPLEKETINDIEDNDAEEEEEGEEDEEEEESLEESENDDEQGIPMSDLDSDAGDGDVDLVPYQKLHKDNHAALTQALSTFALPLSSLPFHIHQSVTSSESVTIDVNDDLSRELAFYKQALEAAKEGQKKLLAEGVPFSRPSDYFAEMIKDDEHMNKVRDRIVAEEASKKASEAAKRQRDLKKFGKQVQVTKIQEREKEKAKTLEKIKTLKRKRQDGNTLTTEDDFDIELEAAQEDRGGKRPKMTREKRNERYGFGGSKRKVKRNDDDAGDLSSLDKRGRRGSRGGGRGGKKKGGPQRPGKKRRMQMKR